MRLWHAGRIPLFQIWGAAEVDRRVDFGFTARGGRPGIKDKLKKGIGRARHATQDLLEAAKEEIAKEKRPAIGLEGPFLCAAAGVAVSCGGQRKAELPAPGSIVFIRKAEYETAGLVVRELLEKTGLVFRGKKVLVKPNILSGCAPERAVTTHPSVVTAVVDFLLDAGADVSVGDNPGIGGYGASLRAARKAGIYDASRGRFVNIVTESKKVFVKSRFFSSLSVSRALLEADLVVNLPKLKTHSLAVYTGAVKNMFGMLVGAEKAKVHAAGGTAAGFGEALADVFAVRPPDASLMDAVVGMEGNGPSDGRPRHVGLLGLSTDSVALDAVFLRLIGVDPARVHHVRIAAERGHGSIGEQAIRVDGGMPSIRPFALPASRRLELIGDAVTATIHRLAFPGITEYARLRLDRKKCTRCGICIKSCPTGAMKTNDDEYPFIERQECIACYCCHELCPETAWKMKGLMGYLQGRRKA
jgi:uncharacterized protein (DUF362 family)/ferredoxin-like protein FixX